jgi:hypothetical protein
VAVGEADVVLDALATRIVAVARQVGGELTLDQVRDILWEGGLPDLFEDLVVAKTVITAADGFHPVARFFAEGSPEREFILRVLAAASGGPQGATSSP